MSTHVSAMPWAALSVRLGSRRRLNRRDPATGSGIQSGQGDGLEQLAIFVPWVFSSVFIAAAIVGRVAAAVAANDAGGQPVNT